MNAKVFSNRKLIGTATLKVGDASMGVLQGVFFPTELYFSEIQNSVWEFLQSDTPDFSKWHSLNLNVQLENGIFLFPQGGYTINDYKEFPDEPKQIDVAGVHSWIIDDFLLANSDKPLVEKPWNMVGIEQKIGFEKELERELGIFNRSFFDFLNRPARHVLSDTKFSTFCHDQRNDNVLFEVIKPGFSQQFALVHLTWTGKKERRGYPAIKFYLDFEEFKNSRMAADKAEWNDYHVHQS